MKRVLLYEIFNIYIYPENFLLKTPSRYDGMSLNTNDSILKVYEKK